jgi:hypothetical protein
MELPQKPLQARAKGRHAADRPLVQPVFELQRRSHRRGRLRLDLLDTEHSPADLENLLGQLQAAAPYPAHPVVRFRGTTWSR